MSTIVDSDLNFQGLAHLVRALLNPVTSDTGLTGTGELWYRTDTKLIKWYDGTTVHTLASLDAVVNTVAATDGTIVVSGGATAPTIAVGSITHAKVSDFDTQVHTARIDQLAQPTATVNFNSQVLTGIANAVNPTDALNLQTAQTLLAQISSRADAYYTTVAALPANTYSNGSSGVGATLTGNVNGALSVDGQAVQVADRLLVQNEVAGANNGIYVVTATGGAGATYILTRASDFNSAANISTGVLVPVEAPSGRTGGTQNSKVFISVAPSPVVVGTSALSFGLVGSTYTAGTGLTLTGTTFALTIPVVVTSGGTGQTTAAGARGTSGLGSPASAPSGGGSGGVVSVAAAGIPLKVTAVIGDGTTTAYTIAHNLGTTNVLVIVAPHGGGANAIFVDTEPLDSNHVTITFVAAPSASQYDVTIIG